MSRNTNSKILVSNSKIAASVDAAAKNPYSINTFLTNDVNTFLANDFSNGLRSLQKKIYPTELFQINICFW